jgi:serine/threonine-protein kinase RsbW
MSDHSTASADAELRLPAEGAYAAVIRTTAAGLAARLDFTIDDIEDLRIAIGEATALVIAEADPGTDVVCGFHFSPGHLTLDLSVTAIDNPEVDRESFAWQVLETMADDVSATSESGIFRVGFSMTSQLAAMPPAPGTGADA